MPGRRWLTAGGVTAALAAVGLTAGASLAGTSPPAATTTTTAITAVVSPDRTSAAESRRVDAVPTPELDWSECLTIAECATVRLPLDYDQPRGATTEVGVLRIKARDQQNRIGSLFVNPGGPGASATQFAFSASLFLSDALLDRFDIVGVDPRGVESSQNLRCFPSVADQTAVFDDMNIAFPVSRAEERAYVNGSQRVGRACSTTGGPLAGAMSTAEVARDHEVLRRAVGGPKLNYLGFSYGSMLGQTYANMFPDRFRAVAVDGVIDPRGWVGDTRRVLDGRLNSSGGARRALTEILRRCDVAGEAECAFAAGDPAENFTAITRALAAKPLVITDEFGSYQVTYADFVSAVLDGLHRVDAGENVTRLAAEIAAAIKGDTGAVSRRVAAATADARASAPEEDEEPYFNSYESFNGVACTDGLHPARAGQWPAAAAARDRVAPHFGRLWAWNDSSCASSSWTVRDEDAYRGPFHRRTAAPVLVVGSFWDPATNYAGAVSSSRLLPNSRLLSSDNWGHTAYGKGACATAAIDGYLLTGALPAKGTVCKDAPQPFTGAQAGTSTQRAGKQLPEVAAPRPESILTSGR